MYLIYTCYIKKTELWEGPCTGPNNIKQLCGIDDAYLIDDFKKYLDSLVKEVRYAIFFR